MSAGGAELSTCVEDDGAGVAHGLAMTSSRSDLLPLRIALTVTALWTLSGALFGYLDTASSFERFHGAPADSEVVLELYRGAWGQTLLFAIGYGIAVLDPRRHVLAVSLGLTGKLLYAARIFGTGRPLTPLALAAGVGDVVLALLLSGLLVHALTRSERAPVPSERLAA
jgi:hypothetical protein